MALLRSRLSSRIVATIALAAVLCSRPAAQPSDTLENDVKAAFLFNFTKFVDWPESAFEAANDPLRMCVVADASFTRSLDRIIAGETVRGRRLHRVVPAPSELPRCHVLYVGTAESRRPERLLSSVSGAPVLTVGESPRFTEQGGAIAFVLVNDRVRFDVNLRAAERAGLTFSSKLLRVARNIQESGRP